MIQKIYYTAVSNAVFTFLEKTKGMTSINRKVNANADMVWIDQHQKAKFYIHCIHERMET